MFTVDRILVRFAAAIFLGIELFAVASPIFAQEMAFPGAALE